MNDIDYLQPQYDISSDDLGFSKMMVDMGVNEEYLQDLTNKQDDRIDIELDLVEVSDSDINGKGIITKNVIKKGEIAGVANTDRKRTQIGRYTNHSDKPNSIAKIVVDKMVFVATIDIPQKTEVTVDYRQVREIAIRLGRRLTIMDLYDQIAETEGHIVGHVDEEMVSHHFSDGVYAREYFLKKGDVVVGKIHRHNHIAMMMQGKAKVFSERGEIIMEAPHIWNSVAGERRAVFAIEDCIFVTIHPTDETDLDKIEEQVIAPDYEALEGLL